MYFSTLSMYNAPSLLLAGFSNKYMESVMEDIMKAAFPFLVLMIVGTGFVSVHPMTGLTSFRNIYIRSLFP